MRVTSLRTPPRGVMYLDIFLQVERTTRFSLIFNSRPGGSAQTTQSVDGVAPCLICLRSSLSLSCRRLRVSHLGVCSVWLPFKRLTRRTNDSRNANAADNDKCFRVPGSVIVLVGTHADKMTEMEAQARIRKVQEQVSRL